MPPSNTENISTVSPPAGQGRGVSYLYMAAAFVIVVAGMRAAESILNPLLLAVFLSVVSAPAYFGLLNRKVSEWLALLTVIGVLGLVLFSVVFVVTKSIAGFTAEQEHYQERLREEKIKVMNRLEDWIPAWAAGRTEASGSHKNVRDSDQPQDLQGKFDTLADESVVKSRIASATVMEAAGLNSEAVLRSTDSAVVPITDADVTTTLIDADKAVSDKVPVNNNSGDPASENLPIVGSEWLHVPVSQRPMPSNEQGWRDYMSEQFNPGTAIALAASVAGSLGQLLSNAFLILLMVIFILLEAGSFDRKMKLAFARTGEATNRAHQIIDSLQHYIVIKTWVSLATGVLIAVWLNFIGVSHAPLWGLLAFMFNFIPNVGSIMAAIPAVLVAWLELTWLPAVACAIGFVIVNGVIGNFIEPRIMGKGLGLSALVVFCSMLFWGWVLGPVGMLLSVPLTMTARIVMDGFEDTRWIATLLGNVE